MKHIALTQRLVENHQTKEIRDALDVQWAVLFRKLNILPLILPSSSNAAALFKALPIEGLVLTGGNDLSSILDDELSHRRDRFERLVLDLALKKKIPILGVCRGMQFIADYFGTRCEKLDGHAGTRHPLQSSRHSIFHRTLSKMSEVNSYHNYGIRQVPAGFVVSASSPDGVVEAMEQPTKQIFAQMWHPEREHPFAPAQISLLKQFFKIR